MNANEATGTRELTEMNGGSSELTLDEMNMVTGGRHAETSYRFTFMGMTFRGDITAGSAFWVNGNGQRVIINY